jgi:hypothetical protein
MTSRTTGIARETLTLGAALLGAAAALLAAGCGGGSSAMNGSGGGSGHAGGAGGLVPPPSPVCDVPAAAQAESIATPTTVVGDGTPASCTAAALQAAVTTAGVITFNCGPDPVTIPITTQIKINNQGGPDKLGDTLIDGGGKVTLDGGNVSRILYLNACQAPFNSDHCDTFEHPHLTVQNLTFVRGIATDAVQGGGAIFANGGRLKVVGCQFSDNHAAPQGTEVKGGAIDTFLQSQVVYIVGSTFTGGSCESGGAIGSIGTSYTVINSTITGNTALAGNGGGICNDGGVYTLTLCGTTLSNNTATNYGGGIFYVSDNGEGNVVIDSSTVSGNTSTSKSFAGGVYVQGAVTTTLRDSTVSGNVAGFAAGVFVVPNAGVANALAMVNDTLSGNQGTALEIDTAITGSILNSTIAGNTRGISSGPMVSLKNTIVSGNSSGNCGSTHPSGGGNIAFPAGGTACTSDVTVGDPALGALGDNGGPAHTLTMLPAAGSAAIGAGHDCPATDQRGDTRPAQGCTSGAVEAQ